MKEWTCGASGVPWNRLLVALSIGLTGLSGCATQGGGGTHMAISVAITNKVTTALANSGTITLNATVQNDPANKGVSWTLTEADGTTCPIGCGAIGNATASSVTYTPPAAPSGGVFDTPIIKASSISDSTKSDQDGFTIISTTVTIANKVKAVQAGTGPITLHAVVANDPTGNGVTSWSLSDTAGVCTPANPVCGSLSNPTATSVVYTPPATVPAVQSNTPFISASLARNGTAYGDGDTFNIISVAVSSCAGTPTGSESLLKGQYAMFAQGSLGAFVLGASFAADGTGKISDLGGAIGGAFDLNNGVTVTESLTLVPSGSGGSGSFYTLGADPSGGAGNVGCFQMTTSDGATGIFRFTVGSVSNGVATSGRIIEYDDQSGADTGVRVSGVMRLQDPTAFSTGDTTRLHTNYAFGLDGLGSEARMAGAGTFTLTPATGAITFNASDGNFLLGGAIGPPSTISSVSAKTGRGAYSFEGGTTVGAVYIVNANEFFLVNLDQVTICLPGCGPRTIYAGRALASSGPFSSALLSGNFIFRLTGNVLCAFGAPPSDCGGHAGLGVITMTPQGNSGGTTSGSLFTYNSQAGTGNLSLAGDHFAVDAVSGRVTLTLGTPLPVLYLATPAPDTESIVAFAVGTDPSAPFGLVEPGAVQAVTTGSLAGNYFFGNEDPQDSTVVSRLGVMKINASGVIAGTELDSSTAGLSTQAVNKTLTIDNVAGPGAGNVGPNTFAVTNGSKLFFIDAASAPPASITVVEHQ